MSPQQKAQIQARLERVNAERASVNAGVGTASANQLESAQTSQGGSTPLTRSKDRHKPGYMAEYMRKRRAK